MKKEKSCNVFGIVMIVALSWINLLHLPWTIWLSAEQVDTGWGGGTGIEMLALAPWGVQFLSLPWILAGIVFFVLSAFWKTVRGIKIANICLFAAMLGQFVMTNLFMYF